MDFYTQNFTHESLKIFIQSHSTENILFYTLKHVRQNLSFPPFYLWLQNIFEDELEKFQKLIFAINHKGESILHMMVKRGKRTEFEFLKMQVHERFAISVKEFLKMLGTEEFPTSTIIPASTLSTSYRPNTERDPVLTQFPTFSRVFQEFQKLPRIYN